MFKTTRLAGYSTFLIAFLAFVLSYSKLTDLAVRAGYTAEMSHLWPLIVDGLAVVATLGVLRLRERRWYAWSLLVASTSVSMAAAVTSALFPVGDLPAVASALVSVVPPLCLLVAPHLAVQLMRESQDEAVEVAPEVAPVVEPIVAPVEVATPVVSTVVAVEKPVVKVAPKVAPKVVAAPATKRVEALRLVNETDLSFREIAAKVGTSDMSVGRWAREAGVDTTERRRRIAQRRNSSRELFEAV